MKDTSLQTRAPTITSLEKRLMLDASLPVIAGQVLWLDADDASTIRDADGDNAATGTGGANNGFGGTIATWVDKSTSGFNVTNATPAQQPTYTLNALNGNNVVTLDGTNDKLINSGAVIGGDDYTAFIVFNRTTAAGRDAVFELGGGASRNGLFINDAGTNRLGFYANTTFNSSSGTYTAGAYEVVTMVHDVSAINMWRNGVNQLSTTGPARASTTGIFIGDDSTGGDDLAGNIAEMIIYDRDLTNDERRDVENYLASKWGRTITGNSTPVIATNTGATVSQSDPVTITSAMLASTDADNSESILKYTITDLADYGTLTNTNTSQTYILGETFTQADINAGYIRYTHNGSANFTDSFSFNVTDQYVTTAGASFNLTITPDNQAPTLQGWTQVSSENFELGATGWNNNTTETSNPFLTTFLGRRSNDGGLQSHFKTYSLSGTQDFTILTFDFYRIDSWDNEQFRVFINDTMVFNQAFSQGYDIVPDGSLGSVSWTAQEVNSSAVNFAYGGFTDQITRLTLRIDNNAAGTIKLGFGSTTNQATSDESWGVDNITIHEVKDGGVPGPLHIVEGMPNGTVLGTATANDPDVGNTLSYSITGGTGSGIFAINSVTGIITLTNTAAVNYETTTSYTLFLRVTDNGTPSLFDQETITINVVDRPENSAAPAFGAIGPLTVAENAANNTVVGTAGATDVDGHAIIYTISAGNTDNIFSISSTTGAIRVNNNGNLNFEWDNSYTLTIVATDNGFGNLSSSTNVVINVTNVNEAPTFNIPQSFLNQNPYLRYNAATGNFYQYVGTTVANAAAFTAASSALLNGVAGHLATISNAAENAYVRGLGGGSIWLGGLDSVTEGQWVWGGSGPEGGQVFSIGATAQAGFYTNWIGGQPDNTGNSDFLEMQASGQWADVNGGNRAYVIEWEGSAVMAALGNGPFTLAENPTLNQSVGFIHARDADIADTISYSITGGTGAAHFAVNATTGEIMASNPSAINYESITSFTLNMRVQDVGGLFSTQIVTINVTDINDAPATLSLTGDHITENSPIGTVVGNLNTIDDDIGDVHTYSLISNPGGKFTIVGNEIRSAAAIDYEQDQSISITVRTDDGNGGIFDQNFMIQIDDVMDTIVSSSFINLEDTSRSPQNLSGLRLGDEENQNRNIFGENGFQVLRETITFKIRDIIALFGNQKQELENNASFTQVADVIILPTTENKNEISNYTNLRQALEFLQQMEETEKETNKSESNTEKIRAQTLPDNTINRQFFDVMTYHQDRVEHLRQALMRA